MVTLVTCFQIKKRKTLRTDPVPTLNLPIKSHARKQSNNLPPREYLTLHVDDKAKPTVPSVCKPCFKNLGDFIRHVDSLKLSGWTRSTKEDNSSIAFSMFDGIHHLPKDQVTGDSSLVFSASVYGWFLPDNHPIYLTHKRSDRFTRAFPLLSQVQELQLCAGRCKFGDSKIQDPVATYRLLRHSIPKIIDPLYFESSLEMQVTVYKRHNNCLVISDTDQCSVSDSRCC